MVPLKLANGFSSLKSAGNIDWQDPTTAKVDTRRVTLHYDKTVTINSGNSNGVFRTFKRWHQ